MDQQVSEDIRSRLEHCTLKELLPGDKIEERQRGLPWLSQRSHDNLAEVVASWENTASNDEDSGSEPPPQGGNSLPKDRNSRTSKLGSLWSIKSEDLGILKSVGEALKQDYDSLLRIQSPADHYEYTCNVETRRKLNRLLWRFMTTLYYDLISELDATKQRCSTTEKSGVATVVAVICKSGTHDSDTVRKKVMGWVRVGRRYRGFMQALCSGCIILFPEKPSDLVWEQYVPIKGDMFTKVIQFLQDLGIVGKCEEEGWNGLSDKILQTLRVHFRRLIPFRFQPDHQSQIGWAANSSLGLLPGDADIHRPERSMLSRDRVEEIQDMDIDSTPSSRRLDSRALPTLAVNRVTKTKRKQGATSVRRQVQSTRDLTAHQTPRPEKSLPSLVRLSHHASRAHRSETQHETHGRDPQGQFPQAPTQCWTSAPKDPGQWHLATNPRIQLQLSVQRKVADTAKSIRFAMKGDIRALKSLFSEGLASPVEVSNSRELSLIGWALYAGMWNYPTVQFLVLVCNALVDDWSYNHAWEYAYRNCCNSMELKGLECVLVNPNIHRDWFEEQEFPEVHKIVLGRSPQLLVTELDDNPCAVYATDAKGRTALAWATARAQLDDMKLLIARHSRVDMMDFDGRSILLNAVDSSNNDGLRIILEAGADPNPVVPKGLFRSSPLIAAAIGSKLEMIELLIDSGAKIDATNPEGWTALQAVIKAQNVECAHILLTRGASLDCISKNGHSALAMAIIYNSHAVLKLLIDWYHTNPNVSFPRLPG